MKNKETQTFSETILKKRRMATHIALINSEECSSMSIKCSCSMCEKAIETLEISKTCTCNECKRTDDLISDQDIHANIYKSTCYQGNIYNKSCKMSYVIDNSCDKSVESTSLNQKDVCSTLRLFTCDKCDKSFKLKAYLHKHKKVHSTLRPYACDICDKYYKRKDNLKKHNKIYHSTLK